MNVIAKVEGNELRLAIEWSEADVNAMRPVLQELDTPYRAHLLNGVGWVSEDTYLELHSWFYGHGLVDLALEMPTPDEFCPTCGDRSELCHLGGER
jgi:hypothetical protein